MSGWLIIYFGFFFIMIIHEIGHALAAKAVGIRFSQIILGFPTIFKFKLGKIPVKIGLVPFIGGILFEDESYEQHPWYHRLFTISAGPLSNLFFTLFLSLIVGGPQAVIMVLELTYLMVVGIPAAITTASTNTPTADMANTFTTLISQNGLMTIFPIIMILNIAVFALNILPIPVLDGGKIILLFAEAVFGKKIKSFTNVLTIISFVAILLYSVLLIIKEVVFLVR